MKVALCLTGHFRTFDYVFPYLKKNILDVYNPDVFGFVWSDSLGYYLHPHDTYDPRFKYGYDPNFLKPNSCKIVFWNCMSCFCEQD